MDCQRGAGDPGVVHPAPRGPGHSRRFRNGPVTQRGPIRMALKSLVGVHKEVPLHPARVAVAKKVDNNKDGQGHRGDGWWDWGTGGCLGKQSGSPSAG